MSVIGWYLGAGLVFAFGWMMAGSLGRQYREDLEQQVEKLEYQNARLRARLRTAYGMRRVA